MAFFKKQTNGTTLRRLPVPIVSFQDNAQFFHYLSCKTNCHCLNDADRCYKTHLHQHLDVPDRENILESDHDLVPKKKAFSPNMDQQSASYLKSLRSQRWHRLCEYLTLAKGKNG